MSELTATTLLETRSITVREVSCRGGHGHPFAEESVSQTHFVHPYRGFFVHHQGREEAVMEANQVLFMNADDYCRVSHPVTGGDNWLTLVPDDSVLRDIAPRNLLRSTSLPATTALQPPVTKLPMPACPASRTLRHDQIQSRSGSFWLGITPL